MAVAMSYCTHSWPNQGMASATPRHTESSTLFVDAHIFFEFITILLYVTEKLSFKMEKREMRVQLVSNK